LLENWFHYWYHLIVSGGHKILDRMRRDPTGIRFSDLRKICEAYFGEPRQSGSSHLVFKTPWPGDPRVNIQDAGGKAKPYQVRQVLKAIDKLESGE
jgi:hypothetical protein